MTKSAVTKKLIVGKDLDFIVNWEEATIIILQWWNVSDKELSHTFWVRSLIMWNQRFWEDKVDDSNNHSNMNFHYGLMAKGTNTNFSISREKCSAICSWILSLDQQSECPQHSKWWIWRELQVCRKKLKIRWLQH